MYGDKKQNNFIYIKGSNNRCYKRTNLEYYITKEEFYNLRSGRKSLKDIVNIINFPGSEKQFNKLLKKFNWDDGKKYYKKSYRHKINEEFFNDWNKENAWVFGWLLTDGSVCSKSYQTKLFLNTKDKNVLEKVKNLLSFTGDIKDGTHEDGRKFSYLRFCRKKITDDLFKLGMPEQNKTFNTKLPDIPNEYLWDFIRGVFEGDGGIRHRTGNTDILDFNICGANKSFIVELKELLEKYDINTRLDKTNSGVYKIVAKSNRDVLWFCYLVYVNSTKNTRMDRKFNVYQNYVLTYYNYINRRSKVCNELVEQARRDIPECSPETELAA